MAQNRMSRSTARALATAAGLALLTTGPALGQDALGSGRALDANLRSGSGRINERVTDFYQDLALRNAIVTGNAPGGQHFRAEVGYRAAGDFLGATAADTLFDFQRESYFSGIAANDVRGLGGLQLQMNVSVYGQATARGLIISRPGAGLTASSLENAAPLTTIDPFASLQGSLRSTSAYLIREADRPVIVGQRDFGQGKNLPLAASPLFGIRPLSLDNVALSGPVDADRMRADALGLSITDPLAQLRGPNDPALQRAREAAGDDGVDATIDTRVSQHEALLESLRAATNQIDLRIDPREDRGTGEDPTDEGEAPQLGTQPPPDQPEETTQGPMDELDAALRRLTASLEVPKDPLEVEVSPEGDETAAATQDAPFDPLDPAARRPEPPRADDEASGADAEDAAMQMLIDALVQEEFTLRTFAEDQTEATDIFAAHMRAGEAALHDGRFMDAEERFSVALTVKPGDAMAALARVQAQIGAGLLRSAALNLRELMRAYPELATMRLSRELTASGGRLERIADRLDYQRGLRRANWIDAAFLSAYIAHLLNDRVGLIQALDDLTRAHTETGVTPDPVYGFLERVWLAHTLRSGGPPAEAPKPVEEAPPIDITGEITLPGG